MTDQPADLLLDNVDEDGKVPERRIKDASTGRNIFMTMRAADRISALMRARHQAMLDGEPPYDQRVLQATGQGGRTNVNWGDAKAVMGSVMAGMIDINASVERLVKVPLKKAAVPDDDTRFSLENILADELTRCIRGWEGYDYNFQTLAHHCFGHGVGIAYWSDAKDWRFNSTGLGEFMVPRGTKTSAHKIPLAGYLESYELHEIYDKIRNEAVATDLGWNVEAVKKAMMKAHPDTVNNAFSYAAWEKFQEMLRDNDYGTLGRTEKVRIIHLWVQEFDGTVSICLVAENPLGNGTTEDVWLYEKRGEYKEMRNAFVPFCYGIGDHGTIHSVSGILREVFPQVQALNRTQCLMLDAVALGTSVLLQPKTEQAYDKMNVVSMGGIAALPSLDHFDVIERAMPNIAQGAMPVIADLRATVTKRGGQFQGDNGFQGGGVEKTRFQVQAELEALGKVGATQANLWYVSWTRLMRETVRRITRDNYHAKEPGGEEVAVFKARLQVAGFPLQLLKQIDIDAVVAERAIGAGSGAARTATLLQLTELAGEYDEVGRKNLTRDRTAAALNGNYELASRYAPPATQVRPTIDTQIALLENCDMEQGSEVPVTDGQLHATHLDLHIPFLAQVCQGVDEGTIPVDDHSVEQMQHLYTHCVSHVEKIQDDPTIAARVGQYRKVLQNLSEPVLNSARKLEAEKRKAMEEGGQEGQQQQGDHENEKAIMKAQIELEAMNQKAQLQAAMDARKVQQKDLEFQQKMSHEDAKVAGKLIADQKVTDAKVMGQKQIADIKVAAAEKMADAKARAAKSKPPSKPK